MKDERCKICGGPTVEFGRRMLLGRHEATYLHCTDCGFLFIRQPTWLDEAYGSVIADVDLGPVERTFQFSRRVKLILHYFLSPDGRNLDFGGGYGLFVRRMRDLGYDFHWHDRYCENLFAKDFVGTLDEHYDSLTAFEVLEHLTDPLDELDAWARIADNLIVSTKLIGREPPPLESWHYYAPETGQHIGFFTVEAMERVAKKLGLHFATDGIDFHLLSKRKVDRTLFRGAMNHRIGRVLNVFVARPTLLARDVTRVRQVALAKLAAATPPTPG